MSHFPAWISGMKNPKRFGVLASILVLCELLTGCGDLPTTGKPIAGSPDGVVEIVVVSSDGKIVHEESEFLKAVDRKDQTLVLVDFAASWCASCRQLTPILQSIKKKEGDRLEVVTVDVDANPAIARHLGVSAIPDVRIFCGGVQVADFHGVLPQSEIEALLRSLK